jgi:L-alanine-DL-glutamate epimerase-like enolase superfamily enzyme
VTTDGLGRRGIAAAAISAVDIALWDLKARLLDSPVTDLLGGAWPVPIYGAADSPATTTSSCGTSWPGGSSTCGFLA